MNGKMTSSRLCILVAIWSVAPLTACSTRQDSTEEPRPQSRAATGTTSLPALPRPAPPPPPTEPPPSSVVAPVAPDPNAGGLAAQQKKVLLPKARAGTISKDDARALQAACKELHDLDCKNLAAKFL